MPAPILRGCRPSSPPPGGDGQNCHEICQALASAERQLSPTRFHNSVHNAAAGYWSIADRCDAGLECPVRLRCELRRRAARGADARWRSSSAAVLLIAYDATYPEPLFAVRPIPDAFAVALRAGTRSAAGSARAAGGTLERCTRRHHRCARSSKHCAARSRRRAACRCSAAWRAAARARPCSTIWISCACAVEVSRMPLDRHVDRAAHPAQGPHVPAG